MSASEVPMARVIPIIAGVDPFDVSDADYKWFRKIQTEVPGADDARVLQILDEVKAKAKAENLTMDNAWSLWKGKYTHVLEKLRLQVREKIAAEKKRQMQKFVMWAAIVYFATRGKW